MNVLLGDWAKTLVVLGHRMAAALERIAAALERDEDDA